MEGKVKALETDELPILKNRLKESEDATHKQKEGIEHLHHSIEKIEEESKQVKEEAAAFEKEITVLKIAEKKWEEAGKNAVHEEAHKELVELREQREKEVADLQKKLKRNGQRARRW